MKILWISELGIPSGFATVTKSLIKPLQKRFDINVLDWYAEKDGFSNGVKVFGKKHTSDKLAIEKFTEIYPDYDAVFILNDVWNIAKYLEVIKRRSGQIPPPKIIAYFPVDARYHNADWYKDFDIVTNPVTYTEFAKRVILGCAPSVAERISIIPHGVDTDVFYKSMSDKKEIREHVYGTKALNDAFIFMSANRNTTRKRLDITVRAFSKFLETSSAKDAYLHLHCGIVDMGMNVFDVVKRFGVEERVITTGSVTGMQNISVELLNLYYNASDVGLNSSMGEGWGLTSVEHAVTGAPQIVPNHSACAELFKDKALLIDSPTEFVFYESTTVGNLADYNDMAKCMARYYYEPELRAQHANAAMSFFLQEEFNWHKVADKFVDEFIK
jgi:D-inositol-3-phosphate glycosyltransferase